MTRLLFLTGPGGAGTTTLAAATALRAAAAGHRVLLLGVADAGELAAVLGASGVSGDGNVLDIDDALEDSTGRRRAADENADTGVRRPPRDPGQPHRPPLRPGGGHRDRAGRPGQAARRAAGGRRPVGAGRHRARARCPACRTSSRCARSPAAVGLGRVGHRRGRRPAAEGRAGDAGLAGDRRRGAAAGAPDRGPGGPGAASAAGRGWSACRRRSRWSRVDRQRRRRDRRGPARRWSHPDSVVRIVGSPVGRRAAAATGHADAAGPAGSARRRRARWPTCRAPTPSRWASRRLAALGELVYARRRPRPGTGRPAGAGDGRRRRGLPLRPAAARRRARPARAGALRATSWWSASTCRASPRSGAPSRCRAALRRCRIASARIADGVLRVGFKPDESLWPERFLTDHSEDAHKR